MSIIRNLMTTVRTMSSIAALGSAAVATYAFVVRPWHLRWGATNSEVKRALPGDELVPNPKVNATHAVTIDVPAARVWPWLVQIGQGRGGFYSYEFVENKLMRLDIHNADRIIPDYQHLNVGDKVPLAKDFSIPVAKIEPERMLVLHGDTRSAKPGEVPMQLQPGDFLNVTWGLYLEDLPGGKCRLIERFRFDYGPRLQNTMFYRALLEPGAFVMERKMLLGIKQRAETYKPLPILEEAALSLQG